MTERDEKLASSLTAESTDLLPFLPYLLQDLWELGSSPEDIMSLLEENTDISDEFTVLDLGCGKGAVSILISEKFKCHSKGIGLIPGFIEEARKKTRDYNVFDLCYFTTADIMDAVNHEKNYDIVIYGAVGEVLGSPVELISQLRQTLKPGGVLVIDDAYAEDASSGYHKKEEWLGFFEQTNVDLIDEKVVDKEEFTNLCQDQIEKISKRAGELKEKYPDHSELFDSYIKSQQAEYDELKNSISGVTFLLKMR